MTTEYDIHKAIILYVEGYWRKSGKDWENITPGEYPDVMFISDLNGVRLHLE